MKTRDPASTVRAACLCGKALSRHNRTGYCRACYSRSVLVKPRAERFCSCGVAITRHSRSGQCRTCAMSSPEVCERRTAGIRAAYRHNPDFLERQRRWMAELNRQPEARARSGEQARRIKLWEYGLPKMMPEVRARQGKTLSDRRLAHIPEEVREEYRSLVARDFTAAEAERIVTEHLAREVERFTARIGGDPAPTEAKPKKQIGRPRIHFPRSCACGEPISYRNTSGWCKHCAPVRRAWTKGDTL